MKVHVVYDPQGGIVAMHTLPPESVEANAPRYGVELNGDHRSDNLEIPARYSGLGLLEIAENLRVSTTSGRPALVPKK